MRRLLFLLACVATLGLFAIPRVQCWVKGRGHQPVRHPMGGFRCAICPATGADLEQMGFEGSSYVAHNRTTFGRGRGEGITRTEW